MEKKKYISEIPELMKEWDGESNVDLDPSKITLGSHIKAWWKCSKCDHKWLAVVSSRGCGHRGCPTCAKNQLGKKLLKIFVNKRGSLAEKRPELAKEWLSDKNGDLKPTDVTVGSNKKVWWKCSKCGCEWQATVIDRSQGHGCPSCIKIQRVETRVRLLVKRKGSFAEKYPELIKEWHPTKNGELTPYDITIGCKRKVWWKCPLGHEYQAYIYNRRHTGCPICSLRQKTSFPEQAIFYYVKKLWPNSMNKYKDCFGDKMELDIYIPEIKTAIEYDGSHWHETDFEHKREIKKYELCKKHKICLIRIKECAEQSWNDTADKIYDIPKVNKISFQALELVIGQLLNSIGNPKYLPVKIDVEKDKNEILNNYLSKIDNSLAKVRPDVAAKWNYEKNGNLTPDMFSIGSDEIVWWKCPDCNKEWKSRIKDLVKQAYGCPICSRIKKGKTRIRYYVKQQGSFAKNMPKLAKEWHPQKNGSLTPNDITMGSHKCVWWKCLKCGYEWQAVIRHRVKGFCKCPKCTQKKINQL